MPFVGRVEEGLQVVGDCLKSGHEVAVEGQGKREPLLKILMLLKLQYLI